MGLIVNRAKHYDLVPGCGKGGHWAYIGTEPFSLSNFLLSPVAECGSENCSTPAK